MPRQARTTLYERGGYTSAPRFREASPWTTSSIWSRPSGCFSSSASTPCCCAGCDMILDLIYAAAALGLGIYMVAALVRPDKF
jgi:hypothetical protein